MICIFSLSLKAPVIKESFHSRESSILKITPGFLKRPKNLGAVNIVINFRLSKYLNPLSFAQ